MGALLKLLLKLIPKRAPRARSPAPPRNARRRADESGDADRNRSNCVGTCRNPPQTQASVDEKLDRYLLNKDHDVGKDKAEWFERALGYNKSNAGDLSRQIQFDPSKAVPTQATEFGQKFNQVIPIRGANGRTIDVQFGWIRNNDGVVRLVTGVPAR